MPIATYSDLQAGLADWLNRADLSEKIPDFITLAEATLNNVLRSPHQVTSATVSISASTRTAPVPVDMLETIYLQSSDALPLEQVSPSQLVMLRRNRLRTNATPRYFAILGRNFEFVPTPASNGSLSLVYYQRIPALTAVNTVNWLITNHPDIYLYTSLMHAAPYLADDARLQVFNSLVTQTVMIALQKNMTIQFDDKKAGFSLQAPADRSAATMIPEPVPNPAAAMPGAA